MQIPPPATFNAFDWFLVLVLVLSTLMAFLRGIIRSLLSLAGIVFGILLASWNYLAFATYLHRWIISFVVAEVVAYVLILVVVSVLLSLLANLLSKTVSAVGLGFLDRLLGAGFGLLRGFLIGVAAMMAIAAFLPDSSWVKDSQLTPYFLQGSHAVSFVVPIRFERQIAEGAQHLLQHTPDLLRAQPRGRYRN